MAELDLLINALDSAIWELGEAFTDFPDEDLWRRPDPRLLSVGELASHIAFGEAAWITGGSLKSPLLDLAVDYYPNAVGQVKAASPLSASEVYEEVKRVHESCKAAFLADPRPLDEACPARPEWTWEYAFQYQAFHIAYHTGQIYSVRHLMGHETVDN